ALATTDLPFGPYRVQCITLDLVVVSESSRKLANHSRTIAGSQRTQRGERSASLLLAFALGLDDDFPLHVLVVDTHVRDLPLLGELDRLGRFSLLHVVGVKLQLLGHALAGAGGVRLLALIDPDDA